MNLNLTLVGQAIAFAIFVTFCMRNVWPPVIQALRERQEKIAQGLAEAEKGAQRREEVEAEIATMLQDAKAQAAEIVAQAQKQRNEMIEKAAGEATAKQEQIASKAMADLDREVVGARETLRKQVGSLAVDGARRILGGEVNEGSHSQVIDDLIKQI